MCQTFTELQHLTNICCNKRKYFTDTRTVFPHSSPSLAMPYIYINIQTALPHSSPESLRRASSGRKISSCEWPSGWVMRTSTSPQVGFPRRYEPHTITSAPLTRLRVASRTCHTATGEVQVLLRTFEAFNSLCMKQYSWPCISLFFFLFVT